MLFSFRSMSGKCNSYTANFKLQVIAFAESTSNSMAALSSLASLPFSFRSMSGKCNSYTVNFKLQVLAFAESTNNSMAAKCFSVNEKLARD